MALKLLIAIINSIALQAFKVLIIYFCARERITYHFSMSECYLFETGRSEDIAIGKLFSLMVHIYIS